MASASLWEGLAPSGRRGAAEIRDLTIAANTTMATLHDLMRVMLKPPERPAWLGEAGAGSRAAAVPDADWALRLWPVSRTTSPIFWTRMTTTTDDCRRASPPISNHNYTVGCWPLGQRIYFTE